MKKIHSALIRSILQKRESKFNDKNYECFGLNYTNKCCTALGPGANPKNIIGVNLLTISVS
jgi:hypothetical protein